MEVAMKKVMSSVNFHRMLDTFKELVDQAVYEKIAYQSWKLLYNCKDSDPVRLYLEVINDHCDIKIMIPGNTFVYSANSDFGSFICTYLSWNDIKEDNKTMNFNFDFGPVNPSLVRMSMYGLAVKNKTGTWVSFNAEAGEIVDVDVLNFDGAKFLYRMPVAIKDIAVGDVVIHNSAPMFVVATPDGGKVLTVIDTINGERKDIMLPRSPFGFNFATKVVNFLGNMMTGANADNPFGNMWMLMALSGDNQDSKDMLPLMLMSGAAGGVMDSNMLMFLALSGDQGGNDMLPWLLMSQSMNAAPTHVCKCGNSCGESFARN